MRAWVLARLLVSGDGVLSVGSAMFGQPKLFSPKPPIRNFFRYIAP